MEDKIVRMNMLAHQLNEWARLYHELDNPVVSDGEYDAAFDELLGLETETGVTLPFSPTLRVGGAPLKKFEPHTHITRLFSMDKVKTEQEMRAWLQKARHALGDTEFCVEHKLDGLKICLTYQNGELITAATRGDGVTGEIVTAQARTIRGIPLAIPLMERMEVCGEVLMRLSTLAKYNETAAEPLKNARNAAAGALRNLDPAVTAKRRLDAFFYSAASFENEPPFDTQTGLFDFLSESGFPVSPFYKLCSSDDDVIETLKDIEEKRDSLDMLIDGAVVKVNDLAQRGSLGFTDRFPRGEIAYKFTAQEVTTTVLDVKWNVGRTGKLTPLAYVDPVDIGGVTVRHVTLNNEDDIRRKNVKIGSKVLIRRANDVIPEILGTVSGGDDEIHAPEYCPHCGSPTLRKGAHIFCSNPGGCVSMAVARLSHFASRAGMDIEGFSERTAELLYNELNIRDPADLYELTESRLLNLPGFGSKRAQNLVAAVNESKNRPLDAFLSALGISNVGSKTAKDLAMKYVSIDMLMDADQESLLAIADIGPVVAQSIAGYFASDENRVHLQRLKNSGVWPVWQQQTQSGGTLQGKTIVVTGTLETLSRKEAESLIESHGGVSAGSVSKKTSFVLAGENAGSKLTKARELGIPVLSESDFMQMLKE